MKVFRDVSSDYLAGGRVCSINRLVLRILEGWLARVGGNVELRYICHLGPRYVWLMLSSRVSALLIVVLHKLDAI